MRLELRQGFLQRMMFREDVGDQPSDLLRDQQQTVLRLLAARNELRLIRRQRIVQATTLEGRREYLLLQLLRHAEGHKQHAQLLRVHKNSNLSWVKIQSAPWVSIQSAQTESCMLVTFTTKAYADITMFGDVALSMLKMMGHSGTVPSAIRAEDVPAALSRLTAAINEVEVPPATEKGADDLAVSLSHRALPLIALLTAAAKENCDVMWK
jgi:hypothetical protein